MTEPLLLDSLEIKNFRAFHHLQIERLGRVNLITGKNNVGKTSLLEALWLYSNVGHPRVVWQILERRDEGAMPNRENSVPPEEIFLWAKRLFCNADESYDSPEPVQIGLVNSANRALCLSLNWLSRGSNQLKQTAKLLNHPYEAVVSALKIEIGEHREVVPLDSAGNIYLSLEKEKTACFYISADGVRMIEIGQLWDHIALTSMEDDVLKALQIIAPSLERINLIRNPFNKGRESNGLDERARISMVRMKGVNKPVALRRLGEGMNRLFGIALALVNATNGLLLIDEIESGLHYSVLPDVWRLVFETARRLNVQVFATTHSWDCIEAFQQAASESEEEGELIRLVNRNGEVIAKTFDEKDLEVATRQAIELR